MSVCVCVYSMFSQHSGKDSLRSMEPKDQDKIKAPVFDRGLVSYNAFLVN